MASSAPLTAHRPAWFSRVNASWETARELLWSKRTVTIVASFLALAFSIRIALAFSIALGSISRRRLW
jgi:hypothetical protein